MHNKSYIKRWSLFFLCLFLCVQSAFNQATTIVLQPNSVQGKDANVDSRMNDTNYGNHFDILSLSWTNGGVPTDCRSLIEFDLSGIPSGSTITSAGLSLYSYNSPANGSHSNLSGSNESVLQRIITPWDENTVTWNNQPYTTVQNQVFIPASIYSIQHYLNMDVTAMVQDMIDNPGNSYGFLLKQVTEDYYRRMVFASSDNSDASLHPKLVITYIESVQPDSCIILQPSEEIGKDANVDSRMNDTNYGNHFDILSLSWTNGGVPTDCRSLIEFDLSGIPSGSTITSAGLSLYSYNSPANGSHSNLSGSNESVLQRIITSWDENTVTWNNQPSITIQNQVFIPASIYSIQHYLNIDVTAMVQDMIDNPGNSYGFLLKQVTEDYYRRMVFASSDNSDASLHPKLEVCYIEKVTLSENINNDLELYIYPNPTSSILTINLGNYQEKRISIDFINATGQLIFSETNIQSGYQYDMSDYPRGLYFAKVYFENNVAIKKVILK